jgi:hypothetical protein
VSAERTPVTLFHHDEPSWVRGQRPARVLRFRGERPVLRAAVPTDDPRTDVYILLVVAAVLTAALVGASLWLEQLLGAVPR